MLGVVFADLVEPDTLDPITIPPRESHWSPRHHQCMELSRAHTDVVYTVLLIEMRSRQIPPEERHSALCLPRLLWLRVLSFLPREAFFGPSPLKLPPLHGGGTAASSSEDDSNSDSDNEVNKEFTEQDTVEFVPVSVFDVSTMMTSLRSSSGQERTAAAKAISINSCGWFKSPICCLWD